MGKYNVGVTLEETTYGWIEVDADDEFDARQKVMLMDWWKIKDEADWGSCGDDWEIHVSEDDIEDVTPPSVSDELWL